MKRILFLPLLQIPSGHHHVADSIRSHLEMNVGNFHFDKIDLLSSSYGRMENLISAIYLNWIHIFPRLYSEIYKYAAVKSKKNNSHFYIYEKLFLNKLKKLIDETHPHLIICTHALPSYLLDRLKTKKLWTGPVINVYTDYFVNNLWGYESIDYHFVPSLIIKNQLLQCGISPNQIFVTGIPINPLYKTRKENKTKNDNYTVLLSGGNMGAGSIQQLLERLNPSGSVLYKVLCGKNEQLLLSIEQMDHPFIKPLSYISSIEEMNRLYDEADAIITKPGGVTITESLWKKLPIFVYEALPGQEEVNLHFLKGQGLIFPLENWRSTKVEERILNILRNDLSQFYSRLDVFKRGFEDKDISVIIRKILYD